MTLAGSGIQQRLGRPLAHVSNPDRVVWGPEKPNAGAFLHFLPAHDGDGRPTYRFDADNAVTLWHALFRLEELDPGAYEAFIGAACEIQQKRHPDAGDWKLKSALPAGALPEVSSKGSINGLALDPGIRTAILDCVRAGNYLSTAAAKVGIKPDLLRQWRQRYPDFHDDIEKARAEGEAAALEKIQTIGLGDETSKPDWKAYAWILERGFGARWGQKVTVEVQQQFDAALKRLQAEFFDEPQILIRILETISFEDGSEPVEVGSGSTPHGSPLALGSGVP